MDQRRRRSCFLRFLLPRDPVGALAGKAGLALPHGFAADLRNELGILGCLAAVRANIVHARSGVLMFGDLEPAPAAAGALGDDLADAEFHAPSLMKLSRPGK